MATSGECPQAVPIRLPEALRDADSVLGFTVQFVIVTICMDLVVHCVHVIDDGIPKFVSEVTFTFEAHLSSTRKLFSNVELIVLGLKTFCSFMSRSLDSKVKTAADHKDSFFLSDGRIAHLFALPLPSLYSSCDLKQSRMAIA